MRSLSKARGFTLIEMMTIVVIIAILASIAYPNYTQFIVRSKLTEATQGALDYQLLLERYYQNYLFYGAGTCGVGFPEGKYFKFACELVNGGESYMVTATSKAGVGLGTGEGDFVYTVDPLNNKRTVKFWGATPGTPDCWLIKKGETC